MNSQNTLVIQSHRSPLPFKWLEECLQSVRNWCELNQYEYQFIGDELFDPLPRWLMEKTQHQKVIATDVARLLAITDAFSLGYTRVVWMDADFLIFSPKDFILPDASYALGREVWIQEDKSSKPKAYKKVHNAFLMFQQENNFLDFYTDTALRLVEQSNGAVPPQFVGPKLLTALHNIASLPVLESAGMLSPMVIKAIIKGEGRALELFKQQSPQEISAANLCTSSCEKHEVSEMEMMQVIGNLLAWKSCGHSPRRG